MSAEAMPLVAAEQPDVREYVDAIKTREAKKAGHVRDVSQGMRREAERIFDPSAYSNTVSTADVQGGEAPAPGGWDVPPPEGQKQAFAHGLREEAAKYDRAVAQYGGIIVDQGLDPHVMGYATVAGGVGTVHVNSTVLPDVTTAEGEERFHSLIGHELAHATLQDPTMGNLIYQTDTITSWQTFEAHAEMKGQEAIGNSITEMRDGQPANYKEAQQAGLELLSVVTTSQFDQFMKEGDSAGLQQVIWTDGLADGSLDANTVLAQAQELGYVPEAEETLISFYQDTLKT